MLILEGGAVVPHTRVSFSHTMGALCSAIIPETNTVASVRDTLQAVEFLTRTNQQRGYTKSHRNPTRLSCQGLQSAHPCGSHVERPSSAQEPFVIQVHTVGFPTME